MQNPEVTQNEDPKTEETVEDDTETPQVEEAPPTEESPSEGEAEAPPTAEEEALTVEQRLERLEDFSVVIATFMDFFEKLGKGTLRSLETHLPQASKDVDTYIGEGTGCGFEEVQERSGAVFDWMEKKHGLDWIVNQVTEITKDIEPHRPKGIDSLIEVLTNLREMLRTPPEEEAKQE